MWSAWGLQRLEILLLVDTERQRGHGELCQCVRLPVAKLLFCAMSKRISCDMQR